MKTSTNYSFSGNKPIIIFLLFFIMHKYFLNMLYFNTNNSSTKLSFHCIRIVVLECDTIILVIFLKNAWKLIVCIVLNALICLEILILGVN